MSNNVHMALICGGSATGKSASLRNIQNPEGVMYLNTEANKRLPFPSKFKIGNVVDPLQIPGAFDQAETMPDNHTIVVDSLTFMMDQYESTYVLGSSNTMAAWGEFAQFFKTLMQQTVAKSTKNVFFTAHTLSTLNEAEMIMETKVPVKGSLKNNGIEAYFSTVVAAKRVTIKELDKYDLTNNRLITITDQERALGFKYCFQTQLTKETVNERIRAPMGMFNVDETFMDNDVQLLTERLHEYYA